MKHIPATGAILLAIAVLPGCFGRQHYKQGEQLIAAGDQEAAIAALREAVAKEPTNAKYQMRLSDLESAAADTHLARAQEMLKANRRFDARNELLLTLDYMPGHPQAVTMLMQLDAGMESAAIAAALPPFEPAEKTADATVEVASAAPEPAPVAIAEAKPVAEPASRQEPQRLSLPPPAAAPPAPAKPAIRPVPEPLPVQTPQPPTSAAQRAMKWSFEGTISRDDDRYPYKMETIDGIIVKLRDTGSRPKHADIEIRVAGTARKYDKLRVGARINGRGVSRLPYQLVITGIKRADRDTQLCDHPNSRGLFPSASCIAGYKMSRPRFVRWPSVHPMV